MFIHNCELNLFVVSNNSMLLLTRGLSLPFPPFPGLGLVGLACCAEWREHPGLTLTTACWDDKTQRWCCDLADITDHDATMADLLEDLGPGWKLHEGSCAVAMSEDEAPFD